MHDIRKNIKNTGGNREKESWILSISFMYNRTWIYTAWRDAINIYIYLLEESYVVDVMYFYTQKQQYHNNIVLIACKCTRELVKKVSFKRVPT